MPGATWATWLWVAMFGLRLAVQVPLYLGASVGWLGTARLVMGVPLWALTLWVTWLLVRTPGSSPASDSSACRPVTNMSSSRSSRVSSGLGASG